MTHCSQLHLLAVSLSFDFVTETHIHIRIFVSILVSSPYAPCLLSCLKLSRVISCSMTAVGIDKSTANCQCTGYSHPLLACAKMQCIGQHQRRRSSSSASSAAFRIFIRFGFDAHPFFGSRAATWHHPVHPRYVMCFGCQPCRQPGNQPRA